MDYNIEELESTTIIHINGQFTFADNKKFKLLADQLKNEKIYSVEINLELADFIDSAALGMLLILRDQCINHHIPISISAADGQVKKALMISKFDQLFTMKD